MCITLLNTNPAFCSHTVYWCVELITGQLHLLISNVFPLMFSFKNYNIVTPHWNWFLLYNMQCHFDSFSKYHQQFAFVSSEQDWAEMVIFFLWGYVKHWTVLYLYIILNSYPRNRPWRFIGLLDVKDPILSRPVVPKLFQLAAHLQV
jgi:hypothetical protein